MFVTSNEPAPVPTIGFASQPSQAWVHHPQRKFDPNSTSRLGELGSSVADGLVNVFHQL